MSLEGAPNTPGADRHAFRQRLQPFGRSWRLDLGYDAGFRDLAGDLRRLKIRNSRGQMIPLGAFATVRETDEPGTLDFLDGQPMVEITANLASGTFDDPVRKLCEAVAEEARKGLGLSREYRLTWMRELPAAK